MDKDYVREKILTALYNIYSKARSRDSQLVGIRDLSREVKVGIPDIKENQVAANVTFLVQMGHVEEVPVENYFAKKNFGGSKPSYKYRLSRDGLGYFEHGSRFDKSNVFAGIGDITGNGNYVVVGNQNSITSIANTQHSEGHSLAENLRHKVNALGELTDEQKISIQSDIETIKSQLAKQNPDTTILKQAKDNLNVLANIATIAPAAIALFNWLVTNFNL
ncbi:MAG: hypothetical protein WAV56_02880 [Microgenomates group bacterium]